MLITNGIFLATILFLENIRWIKSYQTKIIRYDRIDLITPEKREELKVDLQKRTGIQDIHRIEVGSIDFLKDTAFIRISYLSTQKFNSANSVTRLPKPTEPEAFS
jgi:hypothetical protein